MALSWNLRAPRVGGCHPVPGCARLQLPAVADRGDSPVPDDDPSPCVALGLPDQIAWQVAAAVIGLPPLAQVADLHFRRRPELRARIGSRDARHEVNRPLVAEEVKRTDVQDHGADQAAAVTDDALEQRPYIHGAAIGLALLAAQRVHRLRRTWGCSSSRARVSAAADSAVRST